MTNSSGSSSRARKTKYGQISDELAARIESGAIHPGEQLPSSRELAVHYNTSILTVRQAIAQLEKAKLTFSIQGKGVFVARREARPVQERFTVHFLSKTSHRSIGDDHFLGGLLLNLSELAGLRNSCVTVSVLSRHQSFEDCFLSGVPDSMRGGVIITAQEPPSRELLEIFKRERIPYAVIPYTCIPDVPQVRSDGYSAWRDGLKKLKQLGHEKVLLMPSFMEQCEVFDLARDVFGDRFSHEFMLPVVPWDEESGRDAIRRACKRGTEYTAVFSAGDNSTIGVIGELQERGIRIPDDVSLLSYDRYSTQNPLTQFRLTGYQQSLRDMAQALLDLLEEERQAGGEVVRDVLVPLTLIPGTSCVLNSRVRLNAKRHGDGK